MDCQAATAALKHLGIQDPQRSVSNISDGSATLIRSDAGSTVTLLRRQEKYDILVVGAQPDCPVPALRAVLETAVLPLSDDYAARIGVAFPERDALRKRIREASVALDVIAKGRLFSVTAPKIPMHEELKKRVETGTTSVDDLPESFTDNLTTLNQLQANVIVWSKEVDRLVQVSRKGPEAVLSAEEETVFWSTLDAALSTAQQLLSSKTVKLSLDILARKRRATGFLIDANNSLDAARRKASGVLALVQGLPIVALRTAEDLPSLQKGVVTLLEHISAKLRISSFSVERILSLLDSMGSDVNSSIGRILSGKGDLLTLPFRDFVTIFEACCDLFESWSRGFDNCRRVAREAARKKSEAMPPRRRSPLSGLHNHLTGIYELESDHHAICEAILQLSRNDSPSKRLEKVESAYSNLVKNSKGLNHFNMTKEDEASWIKARGAYKSEVTSVEDSLALDYVNVVQQGCDMRSLSVALRPLKVVIDKQFMSSAIGKALSDVINIARSDLRVLQERAALLERSSTYVTQEYPQICVVLSECQLLDKRAASLKEDLSTVIGSTHMGLSSEATNFLSAVEKLKKSVNPYHRFKRWLDSFNLDVKGLYLFRLKSTQNQSALITISIEANVVWFPRILRLAKENPVLIPLLNSHHQEFSRFSKTIFRTYTVLEEALASFGSVTELIRKLDGVIHHRVYPLVERFLDNSRDLIAKGFEKRWEDPTKELQDYASTLLQTCGQLWSLFSSLLENDAAFMSSLNELKTFAIVLDNEGKLNVETQSTVHKLFQRMIVAKVSLVQFFGESETERYLERNWIPLLNSALVTAVGKLTVVWFDTLQRGNLNFEKVALDASPDNEGNLHVSLVPSISDVELSLVSGLGLTYNSFERCLLTASRAFCESLSTGDLSSILQSHRVGKEEQNEVHCNEAMRHVTEILSRILLLAKDWNHNLTVLQNSKQFSPERDINGLSLCKERLEQSLSIYEDVTSLQEKDESLGASENGVVLHDSRIISAKLIAKHKLDLLATCDRVAIVASEASQTLYKKISSAKSQLVDSSGLDFVENTVALQTMQEEMIPSCLVMLQALCRVEELFNLVAKRIGDTSLPSTQSTETWILSDSLKAHFKDLNDSCDLRRASVLTNKESLIRKYRSREEEFRTTLTSLFQDFQSIRNDSSEEETFIDTESLMQDLEHQLRNLEAEGLQLHALSRALGFQRKPDTGGPRDILNELERVKEGYSGLTLVEESLGKFSRITFAEADPSVIRSELVSLSERVDNIALSSGARKAARRLQTSITKSLKGLSLFGALKQVRLSPPRERDLLKRLLADNTTAVERVKDLPLGVFWETNLQDHEAHIRQVLDNAAGEATISDFIMSIERAWTRRKCKLRWGDGTPVVEEIPDLLDELDEHLQALDTMASSHHAEIFETERLSWERRLGKCREELELLADVQRRWAHIDSLFGSRPGSGIHGLRNDLEEEFAAFTSIHARFSAVGDRLRCSQGILEFTDDTLGLEDMKRELQGIVRGLSRFLEQQRASFPRFFFLPDDDLLQVLSIAPSNLEVLMPHIAKLFPGVKGLDYTNNATHTEISSISSKEGEVLSLLSPVRVKEGAAVAAWLCDLEKAVTGSLKGAAANALAELCDAYSPSAQSYDGTLVKTILQYPAQIVLLVVRHCFTIAVESSLDPAKGRSLTQLLLRIEKLLDGTRLFVFDELCLSGDVRRVNLMKGQLIKELVYQRDLTRRLLDANVKNVLSPLWDHSIRVYLTKGVSVQDFAANLRCGLSEFVYGWEYLGVGETLVHTDLTSRCYLTLCESLRRGYGGSPFGPAGTGKTETVKALGKTLGRFVAVFNCDEAFDAVSVGRILAGVCRLGCWVCFDEFNRLSAGILSSTSGQLASVQACIRKNEDQIPNFYGGDLPIDVSQGVGVFVTMNPTYSGRRDLPANLQTLFRPCAMSRPDSEAIAEVLLLTFGFKFASSLAKKTVAFFDSLKTTVSNQPQYDFGLRSLKTTIIASSILFTCEPENEHQEERTQGMEEEALIRGIEEVVKPKLSPEDAQEYDAAVQSIFTEASCLSPELPGDVLSVLREVIAERSLLPAKSFMEKLRQLYWLIQHQAGVMLIGATGSGKSTIWRVLYETLRRKSRGQPEDSEPTSLRVSRATLTVVDPKLLSASELYGNYDHITREWTDGLLTKTLRGINAETNERTPQSFPLHWIIFDGDVDPVWAENLNSVLDDNRILTLPNGEQIPLLENTRILFETTDLDYANPSTVSRCGMICFAETSIPKLSLEMSLRKLYDEFCDSRASPDHLSDIAEVVVNAACRAYESDGLVMRVPTQSVVRSISTLVRSCLAEVVRSRQDRRKVVPVPSESSGKANVSDTTFYRALVVSTSKALCAGLSYSSRLSFAESLLDELKTVQVIHDSFADVKAPRDLSDVMVNLDGTLVGYHELVPKTGTSTEHSDIGNPDVVIPTPTTMRLKSFLQDALNLRSSSCSSGHVLLLCGPPGCGKSLLLTAALKEIPNISLCSLSFSSETSHEQILAALKGSTEVSKRPNGGYVLHPKSTGYRVVLFCDEVNLEKPDSYGTQKSVSLLRSFAEHGGFWDGVSGHWVTMDRISIVAACNPAEDAGRNKLSPRFLANCSVVRVEQPNPTDMQIIYGVFVTSLLKRVHKSLAAKADQVTSAMVAFFTQNKKRFCPEERGPLLPHYIYSPRELSRWVRGLKQLLLDSNQQLKETTGSSHIMETSSTSSWKEVVFAFCHEARRLFIDRLPTADERDFAEDALTKVAEDHLKVDKSWLLDVLYTSWLDNDRETSDPFPRFRIVRDPEQLRKLIYRKLRVFAEEEGLGGSWVTSSGSPSSEESSAMIDQFAVTDEVLTHLTRIERILCNPLGHAVLMGAPGTGKKTLARFAAWMLCMDIHQVHSHSSYSEEDFAQDLRQILRRAGVHGRRISLIFDESHAMESGFLEVMNSLLACGDVPGLFSNEERGSLLEELRAANISSTSSAASETALYSDFINRVRNNLHIVFTISSAPSVAHLQSYSISTVARTEDMSERSPALYNRCTVDWIGDWGKDSLEAVAELKIEVSLGHEKLQIIQSAVQLHTLTRDHFEKHHGHVTITPRHFLEFIEQLNRIALEKGAEIHTGVERHTEGLRRLRHAGRVVDELKDSLEEKSLQLQQKESNANDMLKRMVEEQRSAEKSKVSTEQLALAAAEASAAVEAREDEVSEQLAVVEPKVEAARDAVGSIRKEYLEELRGMPHPPAAVRLALEAVLMVLDAAQRKHDSQYSWANIRSRMRGSEFISSIVNYDAMSLPKGLRSRIETKVLNNPDFDVKKISFASRAAGPLAEWTHAVLDFAAVVEAVEPLQAEVIELHEEREELQVQQRQADDEVQRLELAIEQCKRDYAVLVAEAEKVRQEIKESELNLRRSEEMLDSLADEWNRWVKDLNGFNVAAVSVWGNAVLGAAFLAYAGPFDHSNRSRLCNAWKAVLKRENIPFDDNLQISTFLTSAHERGCWSSRGLPTDSTSLENYAILKRSARFPLIIDPTRRIAKVLPQILDDSSVLDSENHRESKESQITETSFSLTGKRSFIRALESAMRFGTSLILHDADCFDRAVLPLLGQESSYGDATKFAESLNTAQTGSKESGKGNSICQRVVRLGQRDVYLSSSFRMYMSSVSLGFVPRAAITRSNVVSFELSPDALGSGCVSTALAILSPETEKQRKSFLVANLKNQERKRQLEEEVLATVNNVEDLGTGLLHGSLLDNLSNLKKEVRLLEDRQKREEETSNAIKKSESLFQPLGQTAIDIFSVIQRLRSLDTLYEFDTSLFMKTFERTIQTFASSEQGTNDRVAHCQALLLRETYVEVARRIFPRDRLPFASALSLVASAHTACSSGSKLAQLLESTLNAWHRSLSTAHTPSMSAKERIAFVSSQLPGNIKEQLSESGHSRTKTACIQLDYSLQILEASLKEPHRVSPAVDDLACTLPGNDELIHSNRADSEFALREEVLRFGEPSSITDGGNMCYAPILLRSKGPHSDPSSLVATLAGELDVFMINLSMGSSGSDEAVLEAVQVASEKSGRGVKVLLLLRNMHIACKTAKEKLMAEINKMDGKLPFLMIVAMEVTSEISMSAMTGGLTFFKILAFEALPSFRSNFVRGLDLLSAHRNGDMQIGSGEMKALEHLKVILSWLHACLVERASNAPVGFKKSYHFSDGDMMAAWDFLVQKSPDILQHGDHVENAIIFLTHAVYGSRVEYEADNEILYALIAKAFDVHRLKQRKEDSVNVFSSPSTDENIFVPLEQKERRQFIRSLPLEANPQWVHMSSSAPHRKHALEGYRAMEKILDLVQGRIQRIEKEEGKHLKTGITKENTETILQVALTLPDVPELAVDENMHDPVWRFWATESLHLMAVVETIKEQVMILNGDVSSSTQRSRKVPKLRKELGISSSHQEAIVPDTWKKIAPFHGRAKTLLEFFAGIRLTIDCVRTHILNNDRLPVNLSGISRPEALITALQYKEATCKGVAPHSLKAVLLGAEEWSSGGTLVSGISVSGARWNESERLFLLSEQEDRDAVFRLLWTSTATQSELSGRKGISLPLYHVSIGKFLRMIEVPAPTSASMQQWRLQGASLSLF